MTPHKLRMFPALHSTVCKLFLLNLQNITHYMKRKKYLGRHHFYESVYPNINGKEIIKLFFNHVG